MMEYFEHEIVDGCNCINCRMARMEKYIEDIQNEMKKLISSLDTLV